MVNCGLKQRCLYRVYTLVLRLNSVHVHSLRKIDATIKTHATNARHHAMYASARSKLKLSNGKVLKSACMLIVKGPSQ